MSGVEVIGIDHVYIAVGDMRKSTAFYDAVMPLLAFGATASRSTATRTCSTTTGRWATCCGRAKALRAHDPYAPGLHHFCWRVESVADVVAAAAALRDVGIEVSEPAAYPQYAPTTTRSSSTTPTASASKSPTTAKSAAGATTHGIAKRRHESSSGARLSAGLQSRIVAAMQALDDTPFVSDGWVREPGGPLEGDGFSKLVEQGRLLERGGCSFSHVKGKVLPPSATQHRPELAGAPFEAMGVSLVFHPLNPYVPTVHMNVRMLAAFPADREPVTWFGGGMT